jgi:tetratricopeptide (TPR) repeat protein
LKIRTQLAMEFPTVPAFRHELATTLRNLAELAVERQELAQARRLLEQALPHRQAALRADPQNAAYRRCFREERSSLGPVLAGLGDHGAAAAVAEELAGLGWDPVSDCYEAACTLSRCVPMLEKDTKLGAAERQKQAQAYTDRALELLHQTVAKGFHNAAQMKQDEDLNSLRTHPEFQRLLKELESKVTPQAK